MFGAQELRDLLARRSWLRVPISTALQAWLMGDGETTGEDASVQASTLSLGEH